MPNRLKARFLSYVSKIFFFAPSSSLDSDQNFFFVPYPYVFLIVSPLGVILSWFSGAGFSQYIVTLSRVNN
jgi:hypothetical protein